MRPLSMRRKAALPVFVSVSAGFAAFHLAEAFLSLTRNSTAVPETCSNTRVLHSGVLPAVPQCTEAARPSSAFLSGVVALGAGAVTAVLGSLRASPAQKRRTGQSMVARRALGSIDQFKVFGDPGDEFEIDTEDILGVGGQGTVYSCYKKNDPSTKYAVKTIPIWRLLMDPSSEEKIAAIDREVDVLLRIQGHENIATCVGCWDAFRPGTTQAQYKMMVMELVKGGELASFIADGGRLSEDVARSVMKQVVKGLEYIHSKDVLHRDLKVENILVCADTLGVGTQVKLIDFGVAKYISNTLARSCVGTTEIMAPELVSAKMMIPPKGVVLKKHGPFNFKNPADEPPGFGIVTQRPDGKGAMVNGIDPGGQAEGHSVGDGWAITKINEHDVTEMPFIKDFNELGASTKEGVLAIAEVLGSLTGPFTMEFVELPKREFSKAVDMWSLGVVLYTMLVGKTPFKEEADIVGGMLVDAEMAHLTPEAKDLIDRLLQLDPSMRIDLDQVQVHPWLQKEF
mmetsp:Transcript_51584/g.122737  ORF Transcript_51584/g.122737 Transcript_51584/m.122737 type:complete len:512 (+) Transcript_51584:66-1601(+)